MSDESYGPLTPAWAALTGKAVELDKTSIRSLFDAAPDRSDHFNLEAAGVFLDFGRQRLDEDTLALLYELAEQTGVRAGIDRMFAGEHINITEDRAALHVALRRPADQPLTLDGGDVMPLVEAERSKVKALADQVQAGLLKGYSGRPITDIINIGIGGSDLGPLMATDALAEYRNSDLALHFVSNIDGVKISHVLERVDPESTLFVVCSKSFTTLETMTNAGVAREWLLGSGGEQAVAAQFVAVSTNQTAMDVFGIAPDRRFALWDWVGGRYSIWSAVGLTLALAVGWKRFDAFLAGAHEMDRHFQDAPIERNLPVLLALLGIWNRNFLGAGSHAVLPYDEHLHRLPAYLQQLEMESNGKSVRRNGRPVQCGTCPVIWGEPGSNAQHSFYQLLHQGTERVSIDFLLPASSGVGRQQQQDLAGANCLAQTWALAEGDPETKGDDPHQAYSGDRPSSLLMFERLDPATLGRVIALYEHKVYVQGIIWDVNSFDQWGVQLGKRLATGVSDIVADGNAKMPAAIAAALERFRAWRP